ncbi:MAG: Lrp/AsnC family transcriptional regulator [Pseudorhodoplanes sp.]|nr:Lrp/AsnC family transcriptional regulator [Pseudorhodoplanes sp.]
MTRSRNPTEQAIINGLQGGFPLTRQPFRDAGAELGLSEGEIIDTIGGLLEAGRISRFGPLWNAERLGGAVCLCAMAVPPRRIDAVADIVNAHPEVAHNYERAHELNMWFVISAEKPALVAGVIAQIEAETGLKVYPMPKTREFFVGFRVDV